ncbi:hypothetical protein G6F40_012613 [Rhizopus arrhizus]|nr:hypothetical protein G6F40_012613 [Rhizopus arrhizus]
MLDQEKAYDRVHPEYLHKVLLRFGFPPIVVHSLSNLFFGTQLHLNVNGFLSPSVPQLRGLRQGDPISPVLFNLAFEPLLRRIIRDPVFCGFALPRSSLSHPLDLNLQPIKLPAYADDMVCLLHDPNDLNVLHSHLEVYSRASNAQINFHKTLAVSLSGTCISSSATWRSSLIAHRITHWHDRSSTLPATYLGYPLYSSISQRNEHLSPLLGQIKTACQLHSQRLLSVRGRATVLNTLVLSKLWHVLRLTYVPSSFISKLKEIMSSFLTFRMFPKISLSTMCLPRSSGGLGVLDPGIQQHALQSRWLIPLLSGAPIGPPATFWTSPMICNSVVLPRLADCLLHHLQSNTTSSVFTWPLADYRLSFVFRDLRPPYVCSSSSLFHLFFQAIDRLPHNFHSVIVNANTCLQLPISGVLRAPPVPPLRHSISQLRLSLVYLVNPTTNRLRARTNSEPQVHPYLTRRFLRMVRHNSILLSPFLVRPFIPACYAHLGPNPFKPDLTHGIDAAPFISDLGLLVGASSSPMSSKQFRSLCLQDLTSSIYTSPLTALARKKFWVYPVSHACHNVWYRLLHRKIPHRSLTFPL